MLICPLCNQEIELDEVQWHGKDVIMHPYCYTKSLETKIERLEAWRIRQMTFIHLMAQCGIPCECGCKGCQGERVRNEKHYKEWQKEAEAFKNDQ